MKALRSQRPRYSRNATLENYHWNREIQFDQNLHTIQENMILFPTELRSRLYDVLSQYDPSGEMWVPLDSYYGFSDVQEFETKIETAFGIPHDSGMTNEMMNQFAGLDFI